MNENATRTQKRRATAAVGQVAPAKRKSAKPEAGNGAKKSVVQRSVTISKHLVEEGVRVAGHRGFSALVDEALERELRRRRLEEVLSDLDETFGPVSADASQWAARVLESGPRRR